MMLLSVISYAESADCPTLRMFAHGLGMPTALPYIWSQLQGDCCVNSQVICINDRVTEINWYSMGLNGFINGTAIPSGVIYLNLQNNDLTGSIPSNLPNFLRRLSLSGNQLSGDLPSFPSTLEYLYLGYPGQPGNRFTGTLRLNRPLELHIHDNWITDVIIQESSALTGCDLSNNPLLGNANIAGLTRCTKFGLYSAGLLPQTLTTSFSTRTAKPTTAIKLKTTAELATSKYSAAESIATNTFTYRISASTATSHFETSSVLLENPISTISFTIHSRPDVQVYLSSLDIHFNSVNSTSSSLALKTPDANDQNPSAAIGDPILIYGILAGLFGLCVLVLVASKVFKHPKMHSKFGRKNSFGTLNTMNTVATGKLK